MRKGRFLNEAQQFRRGVVYDADRKLEAMKIRRKMDNVRLMEKVRESAFLPFPRAHSDYLENKGGQFKLLCMCQVTDLFCVAS